MNKSSIFIVLVWLLGCSSDGDVSPQQSRLLGKWQLAEYCLSPGDGSCPLRKVSASETQVLDFRKDGTFLENRPQPGQSPSPIDNSGEYRLDGPNTIYFKFDPPISSASYSEVKWYYELRGNTLVLSPPCREACRYTYRRI